MGTKKAAFQFEDYNNADDAKTAILQLHPIGSNPNNLIGLLESIDRSKCFTPIDQKYEEYKACEHIIRGIPFPTRWQVWIKIDANKISELEVFRFYDTL